MSSPSAEVFLSKAVSQIDLNKALEGVKALDGEQAPSSTGLTYTRDTLLNLRPRSESKTRVEHVEVTETPSVGEGIMTPPYNDSPAPPPPTPATPVNEVDHVDPEGSQPNVQSTVNDSVGPVEATKKKKKKSSGKNKKAPATGFEGLRFMDL